MAQDVNAQLFFTQVQGKSLELVKLIQDLRALTDRLAQDATLAGRAATQANTAGYTPLTAQDYTNWQSAIGQVIFAYDGGAPTQKSLIYNML